MLTLERWCQVIFSVQRRTNVSVVCSLHPGNRKLGGVRLKCKFALTKNKRPVLSGATKWG